MLKYTFADFKKEYSTEEACLEKVWGSKNIVNSMQCSKCFRTPKFANVKSRPHSKSCPHCGRHVSITANTIFHNSHVPLTDWFYVLYLFATSKTGLAAAEVERHIDVSYKTAFRMCKQIRSAMATEITDIMKDDTFRKNFLLSVNGTYRHISDKYFDFYIAEFMFRYENRKNVIPPLLFDKVVNTEAKNGTV